MDILGFVLMVLIVALVCYCGAWFVNYLGAPDILPKLIWALGVLYVIYRALGACCPNALHF